MEFSYSSHRKVDGKLDALKNISRELSRRNEVSIFWE